MGPVNRIVRRLPSHVREWLILAGVMGYVVAGGGCGLTCSFYERRQAEIQRLKGYTFGDWAQLKSVTGSGYQWPDEIRRNWDGSVLYARFSNDVLAVDANGRVRRMGASAARGYFDTKEEIVASWDDARESLVFRNGYKVSTAERDVFDVDYSGEYFMVSKWQTKTTTIARSDQPDRQLASVGAYCRNMFSRRDRLLLFCPEYEPRYGEQTALICWEFRTQAGTLVMFRTVRIACPSPSILSFRVEDVDYDSDRVLLTDPNEPGRNA